MRVDLLWLGLGGLTLLPACKGDDAPLLGFDQLCRVRAENICSVRLPPCCEEEAASDCIEQETNSCEAERERIAGLESQLRYHGSRASEKVDAELTELEQCQGPRPLSSFFEGALEEGAACTRDTQCATGLCGRDSHVCEEARATSLCSGE